MANVPKTTTIDNKMMDVITESEYKSNWRLYADNPGLYQNTAVEISYNGQDFVLPLRGKTDDRPGIKNDGSISFIKFPEKSDSSYNRDKLNIIDINDSTNVKEFLIKNGQIRDMETTLLTDIDDVFRPAITQEDSPEMKLFKEAIGLKECDINKYSGRFGDNFLNDKRILKGNSITMKKMKDIAGYLDLEVEITIRDKNSNVPNPMGKEVSIVITEEGSDNDI